MTTYRLIYQEAHKNFLHIAATFDTGEKDDLHLQFPAWRPGRYQLADFAKNVRQWQAKDEQNNPLTSTKTHKDGWQIECAGTNRVTVEYQYYAAECNAGSTFVDEGHFYVNPVNCCAYIKGEENEPCSVALELPEDFIIASAQPFTNYEAAFEDFHAFVDNPIIAAPDIQHNSFISHDITFHLWFNGEARLDWGRIIEDFQKFTDQQINTFGEFPVDEYHYMYQILPYKHYHGVEHQHCTVCSLGPSSQLMNKMYEAFLGVSSHELYHTWNVKAIRPIEMYPYDYARENYTPLGYLAEGVTTYMGDLMLFRSGVFSEKQFFQKLEAQINRHLSNFGRFNHSVSESSFDTWLDGYQKGIPARKVSIYTEGCMISLMLDTLIMQSTSNKKSLDDVMRSLYFQYADKNKGVSEEDYQQAIEDISGRSFRDFFENYVNGTASYESLLYECLEVLGFDLKLKADPKIPAAQLGVKTSNENQKTIVQNIYPGSTADLMKLSEGDEIIAVNGYKISGDLDEWLSYFDDEGWTLSFFRNNLLKTATAPLTNKNYFARYYLEEISKPSKEQQSAFRKWTT